MTRTTQELREDRNTKITALQAMLDSESYDETAYDGMKAEVDALNGRIDRQENLAVLEADLDRPEPSAGAAQAVGGQPIRGPEAKLEFESFGHFLATAAFSPNDQRLQFVEPSMQAEQRMDTGSSGGFAVPVQFLEQIMAVDPAMTPLLARVARLQAGSPPDAEVSFPALDQDSAAAPDHQFGGVTMKWIGEGETKPATELKLRMVTIKPEELGGHVPVTEKLLRNWPSTGAFIEGLLRSALNGGIEEALHNGNGVSKPLGIYQSGAAAKINRNTASTVKYVDLAKMVATSLSRGGARIWLANPALLEDLMQLENSNGNLIWVRDSAVEGSPGALIGYPVFLDEFAPAKGTLGDLALVQPDPYYIVKEGSGPFVATGQSGTDFENNKMKIKISTNIGGSPWLKAPYERRDGSETSPFVLLDVPA